MSSTTDAQPEEGPQGPIVDLAGLYQNSGLLDNIRDTAQVLTMARQAASRNALDALIGQYNTLVERLKAVVDDDTRAELESWVTPLGASDDAAKIYIAAATVSRFLDLVHSRDKFLLTQQKEAIEAAAAQIQLQQMAAMNPQLALQASAPAAAAPGQRLVGFQAMPKAPEPGTGHYM